MKFAIVTTALALVVGGTSFAADQGPTFYRDVLPVLQDQCQDCHRPSGKNYGGMVAPMSLLDYEEARPWARAMARQVASREMPPWDADPKFHGVFANERSLSAAQIATIVDWARNGAAAGDPEEAPEPRRFETRDGWLLGEPDLVLTIPTAYAVGDDVADVYTQFAVDLDDSMLPRDRYVVGFQCKPGVSITHHFNAHLLYPDENGELPPPPTEIESESIAPRNAGMYLGGTASGTDSNRYPEGYGLLLRQGSRITFDVHYHKEPGEGSGVVDSTSQIGFYLTDEVPKSRLEVVNITDFKIDIAPGEGEHHMGPVATSVERDSEIVSLMPHMHKRGKGARFEAFYPDGSKEVLLEVPTYDFGWQTVYYFDELKAVPAGTRIEFSAWYDNSPEYGDLRGFDAEQHVRFGRWSTDEMMMGFVTLAPVVD